jgi:hypothetical protein
MRLGDHSSAKIRIFPDAKLRVAFSGTFFGLLDEALRRSGPRIKAEPYFVDIGPKLVRHSVEQKAVSRKDDSPSDAGCFCGSKNLYDPGIEQGFTAQNSHFVCLNCRGQPADVSLEFHLGMKFRPEKRRHVRTTPAAQITVIRGGKFNRVYLYLSRLEPVKHYYKLA